MMKMSGKSLMRLLMVWNKVKKGYTVSYCRDAINDKLAINKLNNRQVKQLLIGFYGEDICFTYPKDKSKPQMFFSSTICRADIQP